MNDKRMLSAAAALTQCAAMAVRRVDPYETWRDKATSNSGEASSGLAVAEQLPSEASRLRLRHETEWITTNSACIAKQRSLVPLLSRQGQLSEHSIGRTAIERTLISNAASLRRR